MDDAEKEVGEITAQLRRSHREEESQVRPSIIGWRVDCPHCNESFKLTYREDGSYELTVES